LQQFLAASLVVVVVIVMSMQDAALRLACLGTTTDPYLVINNDRRETGVDNG
jgi:hypothetical protein